MSWTKRGTGSCSSCGSSFHNRWKPENCETCGFYLGGSHKPKAKKIKVSIPMAVKVAKDIFSVKTSNRDDRCFVTKDGKMWMCLHEVCKEKRATYCASNMLHSFTCQHIQHVEQEIQAPLKISLEDGEDTIEVYCCSGQIKASLTTIVNERSGPMVTKVSEKCFAVHGPPTASNTLGFCHVRLHDSRLVCTGKDCRAVASKGKQCKVKNLCIHLHVIFCFMPEATNTSEATSTPTCSVSGPNVFSPSMVEDEDEASVSRTSTMELAKNRKLPYNFSEELIQNIIKQDCNSVLGLTGGWPESFVPDVNECELCNSPLSSPTSHPGQKGNSYLLTENNPFKKITVKVKFCTNKGCKAMYQVFPVGKGLFNIADKIIVSISIMLGIREFFKKGHPLGNIIDAKFVSLQARSREEKLREEELVYLRDVVYNGFFGFEMMTERDLESMICGICGITPEICLGDGNEKNCCSVGQIVYTKEEDGDEIPMMKYDEFLEVLKIRSLEKVVYTRNLKPFQIHQKQIPPLISPTIAGDITFNTEHDKKSVYLKDGKSSEGDQAVLHSLIVDGKIDMEGLEKLSHEELVKICEACQISTSRKSKTLLIGDLQRLYASILVGLSPCHTFSNIQGKTGGFYHFVCRHGCTVASKFLTLTESVRDAADLYLSLKYPPIVFVNDTPCGFVRHMECRCKETARKLWGERAGCFEKPCLDKEPYEVHNIPDIIPGEYRRNAPIPAAELSEYQHPLTHKTERYVLGDRFHSSSNPHKSPLCEFHNINKCLQANSIKTSIQESQNHRKNKKRLRSAPMQNFETHVMFNFLMDFYQNRETVEKQRKNLEKTGHKIVRDRFQRFVIVP